MDLMLGGAVGAMTWTAQATDALPKMRGALHEARSITRAVAVVCGGRKAKAARHLRSVMSVGTSRRWHIIVKGEG